MSHVASSCGSIMDVFGDMVDMWEQLNFTNVKPEGKFFFIVNIFKAQEQNKLHCVRNTQRQCNVNHLLWINKDDSIPVCILSTIKQNSVP